ncbi:hypothetical protein ACOZ4L_00030 [Haloplanus ruber]|uniref:HNH endonuclease n=1 Tax=Haloplanus ruber TaxID=869892 RepID=A0ABD6D0J7_9EURY|nr:hypothetical protein [Haloplanus ruber]
MVQLRSCYFCGGVGDSLHEYEVVPERLDAGGNGRSAVLCSACHEKLRRMLEPLAEASETAGTTNPGPASLQEVTFGSGADGGASTGTADAGADGDATPKAVDEADASPSDRTPPEPSSNSEATDERTGERSTTSDDEGGAVDDDVPEEYYTVLRLLQNREFPMERTTLVDIVTGAYDVSKPQCDRILETAIERGVLVADGSTLDLGRS